LIGSNLASTLCDFAFKPGKYWNISAENVGIDGYFVHSQVTESFGGCSVGESCLCFDDKWEYSFEVCTAVKQDQNVHHHRSRDIKLWLSSVINTSQIKYLILLNYN